MTDYVVETEFQGPGFVAVPNAVAQSDKLGADALGVLVWLASQPAGFVVRVVSIRERFGFGKDKWQRIARELKEVGALESRPARCKAGRVLYWRMVVRWPELGADKSTSRKTRPLVQKPGFPASGNPATNWRKTRHEVPENPAPYKETNTKKGPAALNLDLEGFDVSGLSSFQRSCLWAGQAMPFGDGRELKPNDPRYSAFAQLLRKEVS